MERTRIEIGGMSCGHCVAAVAGALKGLAGVEIEEVKVGSATVTYDPQQVTADQLAGAIEDEGYEARVAGRKG